MPICEPAGWRETRLDVSDIILFLMEQQKGLGSLYGPRVTILDNHQKRRICCAAQIFLTNRPNQCHLLNGRILFSANTGSPLLPLFLGFMSGCLSLLLSSFRSVGPVCGQAFTSSIPSFVTSCPSVPFSFLVPRPA